MKSTCPRCATPGRKVGITTLNALVKPHRLPVDETTWWYCGAAGGSLLFALEH